MGLKLGAGCTANRNTNTYGSPTWAPINLAQDVNQDQDWQSSDASNRGQAPFSASEPTLLDIGIDLKILEDHTDTQYLALRSAHSARTVIDLLISTGGATTTGELTFRADFKIHKFKRGEPLNGINTVEVSLKPCYSTHTPTYATA